MSEEHRLYHGIRRFAETGDFLWPPARKFYERIAPTVNGKTVVEVGCGIGVGTALFYAAGSSGIYAIDAEFEAIAVARSLYPWMGWRVEDITAPSTKLPEVDVVVAIEVIEHIAADKQQMVVDKMLACAREKLWLSTPNALGREGISDKRHPKELAPAEVRAMMRGLQVKEYSCFAEVSLDQEPMGSILYEVSK